MPEITYAHLRVLQAIARTGEAPRRTRRDFLRRMHDAGLIGPLGTPPGGREEWLITKAGRKAMDRAETQQACEALGARLNRILG